MPPPGAKPTMKVILPFGYSGVCARAGATKPHANAERDEDSRNGIRMVLLPVAVSPPSARP